LEDLKIYGRFLPGLLLNSNEKVVQERSAN